MGCNCGKPKCNGKCGCKSPAVLQINNPAEYITFHKVVIPASLGDSKTYPPRNGMYRNVLTFYEADQTSWLYSTDGIPTNITGATGPVGPKGPSGTMEVGTTTTGEPGTDASVENVGNPENAILNFTIPKGDKGEQGEPGPQGFMNEQDVRDVVDTIIPNGFFDDSETVNGQGTEISLDNTAYSSIKEVKLYGNSSQQVYSGENLIGLEDYSESTEHGVTFSVSGEVLSANGSSDGTAIKISTSLFNVSQFSQGDKPRITVIVESGTWTAGAIGVEFYVGATKILTQQQRYDGSWAQANAFTGDPSLVTSADIFLGGTFVGNNLKARIMLTNKSTPATSFETYVGGESSPNANYPQQVKTATGDQVITISDGDAESRVYHVSLGDIEICESGTYRDYIYKNGSDWYIHKEIKKKTFTHDDTHSINVAQTNTARIAFAGGLSDGLPKAYSVGMGYSNLSSGASSDGWNADIVGYSWHVNSNVWWKFPKRDVGSTSDNVEAWMSDKTFILYYPLDTAQEIKITDSLLIDQLETLAEAKTYEGGTTLSVDGDLPVVLSVEAFIDNWNGTIGGINAEIDNVYTKHESDRFLNVSNYYDEIIYTKERHNHTDCYLAEVPLNDKDGNQIAPYAAYHPDDSPLEYAQKNFTSLTVNSSMSVGDYELGRYPTVISNGEIVNNYTGTPMPTNEYWYLGITAERELRTYTSDTTAEAMLADGAIQAFLTFGKIVDNGVFIPPEYSWADRAHPRMVMGEKNDGTLLIMATDGRTDINTGLTEEEAAQIMIDKGCVNVWNFDGGGSTSMTINGSKINRNIDGSGTQERDMHVTLNFKKATINKNVAESFSNTGIEKQKLIQQIIPYVNELDTLIKDTRRIDGEDLDDLINENMVAYGNDLVNRPIGNNGYFINLTYPGKSPKWNKQFFLNRQLNQIYMRTMENEVFSNWIRLDGSNKAFFASLSGQTLASSGSFEPIYMESRNNNSVVIKLDPNYINTSETGYSGFKISYGGGYSDIRACLQITPATSGAKEICIYRNGGKINASVMQFNATAGQVNAVSYEYMVANGTSGDTFEVRIKGSTGDSINDLWVSADING